VPTAVQIIGLDEKGTSFELMESNVDGILGDPAIRDLPAVVVSVAGERQHYLLH
jgi:hypothetical protein